MSRLKNYNKKNNLSHLIMLCCSYTVYTIIHNKIYQHHIYVYSKTHTDLERIYCKLQCNMNINKTVCFYIDQNLESSFQFSHKQPFQGEGMK